MVQYERIDISEGIATSKASASREYMLCHYWCFKGIGYKFESIESNVCNKCHDVLMTAYELKNIAILNVKVFIIYVFYGLLVEMKLLIF